LIIGLIVNVRSGGLFFTVHNLSAISIQIAVVTIVACAMTLVMIAGSIDVSVSGIVVLTGVAGGLLIVHGVPMWLAFVLATVCGMLVGLVNSFLVLTIGITSLIATIGTLYVTQGVANLLTNGLPIAGLPLNFSTVGAGSFGPVPIALPMIIGIVGLFVCIQRFTVLGRYAVATGSNPQGAFLNGVNVRLTTTLCFVLSGAAAGWGGVVYASRVGTPSPVVDNDLLFQVIVAIVIGGTSLFGGEGSVFGTLLGSILIGTVNNGLDLLGISTYWQYIALGALLTVSVGIDTVARRESVYRLSRALFNRVRTEIPPPMAPESAIIVAPPAAEDPTDLNEETGYRRAGG
jgi:ribose/xylose/arabinose/galactoside ABC-type transport system permease subunit